MMGGEGSDMFAYFKMLLLKGMLSARKHHDRVISLVEVMSSGEFFARLKNTCWFSKILLDGSHLSGNGIYCSIINIFNVNLY